MFKKLVKFIHDKANIKHKILKHKVVYTAFDKAKTLKVNPSSIIKTLVINADRKKYMVVLPGDKRIDINKLKKSLNAILKKNGEKSVKTISIAKESWIKKYIRGVKVGNIPPFGFLWKLPTIIDKSILKKAKVIINSGDYKASIEIPSKIFKKVENAIVLSGIADKIKLKMQPKKQQQVKRKKIKVKAVKIKSA